MGRIQDVKNEIAFMTSNQHANCVNEETSCNRLFIVCVCVKTHISQTILGISVHVVTRVECVKRILGTATDAEEQQAS